MKNFLFFSLAVSAVTTVGHFAGWSGALYLMAFFTKLSITMLATFIFISLVVGAIYNLSKT